MHVRSTHLKQSVYTLLQELPVIISTPISSLQDHITPHPLRHAQLQGYERAAQRAHQFLSTVKDVSAKET